MAKSMIQEPPHLVADLKSMYLTSMASQWRRLAEEARSKRQPHAEYLADLARLEVTGRRERRIQRRIKDARFPMLKTLDAFDFEAQPDGTIAVLTKDVRRVPALHPTLVIRDNFVTLLAADGRTIVRRSLYNLLSTRPELFRWRPESLRARPCSRRCMDSYTPPSLCGPGRSPDPPADRPRHRRRSQHQHWQRPGPRGAGRCL